MLVHVQRIQEKLQRKYKVAIKMCGVCVVYLKVRALWQINSQPQTQLIKAVRQIIAISQTVVK